MQRLFHNLGMGMDMDNQPVLLTLAGEDGDMDVRDVVSCMRPGTGQSEGDTDFETPPWPP